VYVVPFSHLDLYWGGTREECLSRGNRIITRAVQLAEKHPDFRFLIEDNVFLNNFAESRSGTPELETLKRLVREGRFEIAPKWAGIYQNLPRGESQIRNLAYGLKYAREAFGVTPRVAHLGDLPGYTWQYPQIDCCFASEVPLPVVVTSCASVSHATAPLSLARLCATSRLRLYTAISTPPRRKRRAILAPMRPSPTIPNCMSLSFGVFI